VFAADHRVGNASRRGLHARKGVWIGQKAFDRGVEKGLNIVGLDIPSGQNTGKQFIKPMTLRNGQSESRAARVEPIAPGPPSQRLLDAQEMAVIVQLYSGQSHARRSCYGAGQPAKNRLVGVPYSDERRPMAPARINRQFPRECAAIPVWFLDRGGRSRTQWR